MKVFTILGIVGAVILFYAAGKDWVLSEPRPAGMDFARMAWAGGFAGAGALVGGIIDKIMDRG